MTRRAFAFGQVKTRGGARTSLTMFRDVALTQQVTDLQTSAGAAIAGGVVTIGPGASVSFLGPDDLTSVLYTNPSTDPAIVAQLNATDAPPVIDASSIATETGRATAAEVAELVRAQAAEAVATHIKGLWTAGTSYAVGDVVQVTTANANTNALGLWRCLVAHTSGAAFSGTSVGNWMLINPAPSDGGVPISTSQASTADTAVQMAAATDASTKANARAAADLSNVTPATGRAALGLGTAATQASGAFDAAGAAAAVTPTSIGLGNVNNTADSAKPVSTAQAAANSSIQTAAATDATNKANARAAVDLSNVTPATGRTALGLGTAATSATTAFDAAGAAAGIVKGAWVTATVYAVGDLIQITSANANGYAYGLWRCLIPHTSGATFSGTSTGNWTRVAGDVDTTGAAAAYLPSLDTAAAKAARPGTDYARDDFNGTAGTTLASHVPDFGITFWAQRVGTLTLDGNGSATGTADGALATFDAESSLRSSATSPVQPYTAEMSMTAYGSSASVQVAMSLVFRYIDTSNFHYIAANAGSNRINVYRVTGGTHQLQIQLTPPTTITSGAPVIVRVDNFALDYTVWIGGTEIVTLADAQGASSTNIGLRYGLNGAPGAQATAAYIAVRAYQGLRLNWPRMTAFTSNPIVSLGAAGTWEATDINNPQVVWDPLNALWTMEYSGYTAAADASNGSVAGSLIQASGIATASNLYGPWTKDGVNPVQTSTTDGGYNFNGGMVWLNGLWYHAYNVVASTKTSVRLATSPDKHTWTDKGVVFAPSTSGGWDNRGIYDPFLRVRQDGQTLELWYAADNTTNTATVGRQIGYAVSTDLGLTWTRNSNPTVTNPGVSIVGSFAEPAVWVPPGMEGKQALVMYDAARVDPVAASTYRFVGAGITVDGGVTWHHRLLLGFGAGTAPQVFDAFPLVHDGRFYVFHSQSPNAGGALNLAIQIGVSSSSAYTPTSLAL